jgi:hypothetical protein
MSIDVSFVAFQFRKACEGRHEHSYETENYPECFACSARYRTSHEGLTLAVPIDIVDGVAGLPAFPEMEKVEMVCGHADEKGRTP